MRGVEVLEVEEAGEVEAAGLEVLEVKLKEEVVAAEVVRAGKMAEAEAGGGRVAECPPKCQRRVQSPCLWHLLQRHGIQSCSLTVGGLRQHIERQGEECPGSITTLCALGCRRWRCSRGRSWRCSLWPVNSKANNSKNQKMKRRRHWCRQRNFAAIACIPGLRTRFRAFARASFLRSGFLGLGRLALDTLWRS